MHSIISIPRRILVFYLLSKIQKHKKMEEDAIKKKADNFEKMKKNKRASRRKNKEKPSEEELQNMMGKVTLQKTVTISKED